jgi:hypothetical protein
MHNTKRSATLSRTPDNPRLPERSIFRAQALQHYIENLEKVVLPNLVSPRAFALLWITATLVMIAGLIFAFRPWLDHLLARMI